MKRASLAALIGAAVLTAAVVPAAADCMYNGQQYAEGTQIGDRTCRDGGWVNGG